MKPTVARIAAVLFFSGFCSLVYQVAWLRLLRLVFGASTSATAVVLAIFMGGLGLGGAVLGRRAERVSNPLAFYARLELGIAVAAAVSPLLVQLVRQLYVGLGGTSALGLGGATALRLVFAAVILGVPATLMGGTLPAVAQAMERDSDQGRRLVAGLYGINTFGAVAGAFLTTFLLLELLGIRQSLWLASALNLLLAWVVWKMSRQASPAAADNAPRAVRPAAPARLAGRPAAARTVLFAAFLVGFVFFLMELVWYRMLAPILGGSSYTFGLILTVALAGIAAGGGLYALGGERRRPTLGLLAWTCNLEAVGLAVPYALGDDLALLAAILRQLDTIGFGALVLSWTVIAVLVVLPAAVVAGYQFPLLIALLGSGRDHVGSQVGLAYAWNTWGAILGSLAGGFGLIPLLSAPRLWRLSAGALLLIGLALGALEWRRRGRLRPLLALAGVALLAAGLCQARGPSAFWRHTPIGAGRVKATFREPNQLRAVRQDVRRSVVREVDGVESSVALRGSSELSLVINGKSDGSALGDAPTMAMLGLVGGLLHAEPKRALVIGLGTGATAGWLARIDSIERIDVIELEPAIGALAAEFAPINFAVLDDPKVNLVYGDGREVLLTTSETYDLIMSQPSNPYRAGVADLFSQDFYRAVEPRLDPGGIFLQWLQAYEIDADLTRLAYSSLFSVFPNLESWQVNVFDLLLVATREPLVHDFDRIRREVEREPYRSALAWLWRVRGIEGFYSGFVADAGLARHLAEVADFRLSSDDRPRIEFGFARNVGHEGLFSVAQLQGLARAIGADRPTSSGAPIDWLEVREARQIRATVPTFVEFPPAELTPGERLRRLARQAYAQRQLAAAEGFWRRQERPATLPLDRLMMAEVLIENDAAEAPAELAGLDGIAPAEATFLAARRHLRSGDEEKATAELVAGLEALRSHPWAYQPIVVRGLELAERLAAVDPRHGERLFAALEDPFPVHLLDDLRHRVRVRLLRHLDFAGRCVAAFEPFEPHVPWEEDFLAGRWRCYDVNRHALAGQAREDLEELLAAEPPSELDPAIPLGRGRPG